MVVVGWGKLLLYLGVRSDQHSAYAAHHQTNNKNRRLMARTGSHFQTSRDHSEAVRSSSKHHATHTSKSRSEPEAKRDRKQIDGPCLPPPPHNSRQQPTTASRGVCLVQYKPASRSSLGSWGSQTQNGQDQRKENKKNIGGHLFISLTSNGRRAWPKTTTLRSLGS